MPSASSISVLIVDDQVSIRQLVRGSLHQLGFRNMEEASDGEAGLRKLVEVPANLILADFNMPKLDGLGMLRAVRAYPPTAKTAFIMLTGSANKELVESAVKHGVNNYLVKPFTAATLKQKIEAVFGKLT